VGNIVICGNMNEPRVPCQVRNQGTEKHLPHDLTYLWVVKKLNLQKHSKIVVMVDEMTGEMLVKVYKISIQ
jgi:hypothetical protein